MITIPASGKGKTAEEAQPSPAELIYTIQSGAELNTALPTALDVNVPGSDFPLFWSVITPEGLAQSLEDSIAEVGSNPTLTWQAAVQSETQQSRVLIHAGFLNEMTGEFSSYECELEDDGEFTLSEEIQSLYNNEVRPNFVDIVRFTRSIETQGDLSIVNVFVQKY